MSHIDSLLKHVAKLENLINAREQSTDAELASVNKQTSETIHALNPFNTLGGVSEEEHDLLFERFAKVHEQLKKAGYDISNIDNVMAGMQWTTKRAAAERAVAQPELADLEEEEDIAVGNAAEIAAAEREIAARAGNDTLLCELEPTGNAVTDLRRVQLIEHQLVRIKRMRDRRIARDKDRIEQEENATQGVSSSKEPEVSTHHIVYDVYEGFTDLVYQMQASINQAQIQTNDPRPRYYLYQISAYKHEPLHQNVPFLHYPGYTNTPTVQCCLIYDNSDNSYKLDVCGRPKDWGFEVYKLVPSDVDHLSPNIERRFTVHTLSGVVIQLELYSDEDVEGLMGFLKAGAVAAGAIS